jgi:hypothetical protein
MGYSNTSKVQTMGLLVLRAANGYVPLCALAEFGRCLLTGFAQGTYKGTLLGVNHLDLINWSNRLRFTVRKWLGKKQS